MTAPDNPNLSPTQFKAARNWKSDHWSVQRTYDVHHNGGIVGHVKSKQNASRTGSSWSAYSLIRRHLGVFETRGDAAQSVVSHHQAAEARRVEREREKQQ